MRWVDNEVLTEDCVNGESCGVDSNRGRPEGLAGGRPGAHLSGCHCAGRYGLTRFAVSMRDRVGEGTGRPWYGLAFVMQVATTD